MVFKHHIIPFHEWRLRIDPKATRWNKDFNALDNIVWLTREQHAQAHLLLFEINGRIQDRNASIMIAGNMDEQSRRYAAKYRDTSYMQTHQYKDKVSAAKRGNSPAWNKGIPCSMESRQNLSLKMTGNKNCLGRIISKETKEKLRANMIGKIRGPYKKKVK